MKLDGELDIDNRFKIGEVRCIKERGGKFYILANKCERQLGTYLIALNPNNPEKREFLINWKTKLDIADADIFFITQGN